MITKRQQTQAGNMQTDFILQTFIAGQASNIHLQICAFLHTSYMSVTRTETGNFTKNPVIKFLNHEISGKLTKSDIVDKDGFFIGNYPKNLSKFVNVDKKFCIDSNIS